MSNRKTAETASGSRKRKPWRKNLIFALVVLVLAAALYFGVRAAHSGKGSGLQAVVDFGDGITETLPLDTDHDYLYDVGDYVVHLQVKDGAVAFWTVSARTMCVSNSAGWTRMAHGLPASLPGCMWS